MKPCASLVQIREIPLKNCGIVDFPQCRTRFDGFYSLVNPETFDVSHFHVRILLAELFLQYFADFAAGFALLFHALDGLVGSIEGGRADLGAEIADALVPGQQLEHVVQGGSVGTGQRRDRPTV